MDSMNWQYWWWTAAIVLAVAEMATGTFYLLVIACAAAFSGLLAWLGLSELVQLAAASVSTVLGIVCIQLYKKRCARQAPKLGNNLDIGQTVEVLVWVGNEGRARVDYRGTQWDARLDDLSLERGERMRIIGAEGSTFILGAV
ncbi:MAG: NfeD family protein [Brachymonas sp.]|jgi:membrane protein implicated in regulation of membrane protease activity